MTHTTLIAALLALLAAAIALASPASACDPGFYYQSQHGICAPYPDPYAPAWQQPQSNYPYPPSYPQQGSQQ